MLELAKATFRGLLVENRCKQYYMQALTIASIHCRTDHHLFSMPLTPNAMPGSKPPKINRTQDQTQNQQID
jgi:hypothetical protein